MIGFRSGLLVVQSFSHTEKKRAHWRCRCDCGKEIVRMGKYLRRGEVKSCGCLNRQAVGKIIPHGHTVGGLSPTYRCWAGMLQRCLNPKSSCWYKYGGRGIRVCKRWRNFENFLRDMGDKPAGLTIGRKNNDGHYTKRNCEWQTWHQQAANTRKSVYVTFRGVKLHLAAWARRLNVGYFRLHGRVRKIGGLKAVASFAQASSHNQV